MLKTNKKIVFAILLMILAVLLNTKIVFADDVDKAELFKYFKEEDKTEYYTSMTENTVSKYYGLNFYTFNTLNASVNIDNTNLLTWEKKENDNAKYFYTQGKEGKVKVKVTITYKKKKVTKNYTIHIYNNYDKCRFEEFKGTKFESTYNLLVGESIYITNAKDLSVKSSNNKVADSMPNDISSIVAKSKGSAKITATAKYNGETAKKSFKVNVKKINDAKLESKDNDVVSIAKDVNGKEQILLANGDLWNIDDNLKINKKTASNVKKHVYTAVYDKSKNSYAVVSISSVLKNDDKLEVKTSIGNKTIKNVKDVYGSSFLKKNGEFSRISSENKKLKITKKVSGVSEIYSSELVKKDGKLYSSEDIKVTDQNVVQAFGSEYSGVFLNSANTLYKYRFNYTDKIYSEEVVEQNVKKLYNSYLYETKNGKLKYIYAQNNTAKYVLNGYLQNVSLGIDKNNKLYANDVKVLTNVVDVYSSYNKDETNAFIVKKDGSIWVWTQKYLKESKFKKIRSGKSSEKAISQVTKLKAKKQGKNKAKVTWKKVGGAKKYTIYRATSKNRKYKKIGNTTSNSFTDKKAKKGKTYYYKVVTNAYNGKYSSSKTSAVSVKM